jgi:hypothetical protein
LEQQEKKSAHAEMVIARQAADIMKAQETRVNDLQNQLSTSSYYTPGNGMFGKTFSEMDMLHRPMNWHNYRPQQPMQPPQQMYQGYKGQTPHFQQRLAWEHQDKYQTQQLGFPQQPQQHHQQQHQQQYQHFGQQQQHHQQLGYTPHHPQQTQQEDHTTQYQQQRQQEQKYYQQAHLQQHQHQEQQQQSPTRPGSHAFQEQQHRQEKQQQYQAHADNSLDQIMSAEEMSQHFDTAQQHQSLSEYRAEGQSKTKDKNVD